nr:serine hydrolase [Bacteroidota bacterium]
MIRKTISLAVIFQLLFACNSFCQQQNGTKNSKINELMEDYSTFKGFNGAILVAVKDQIIFEKAFGYSNFEWEIPNSIHTKFRIASITKSFTAILVMQQVEEGKLKLDGKVSDYLPDYPKTTGDKISIHHLLTHSSGIIDFPDVPEDFDVCERKHHTIYELFEYFQDKELLCEPGSMFRYSNFNYIVLAAILEQVSGQPYPILIQERIFAPAGMHNSGIDDNITLVKNRAQGYYQNFLTDEKENATFVDMSVVIGAGDIYSTIEDMFKFNQALTNNVFITPESLAVILTPNLFPNMQNYGYGWDIKTNNWGPAHEEIVVYGSAGSINGFKSNFRRFDNGNCIVVLSNYKDRSGTSIEIAGTQEIINDIAAILYDRDFNPPSQSIASIIGRALVSGEGSSLGEIYESHRDNISGRVDFNGTDMLDLCYYFLNHDKESYVHQIMKLDLDELFSTSVELSQLAALYYLSGEKAKATTAIDNSLKVNEYGDALLRSIANFFIQQEQTKAAIFLLEKNTEEFPSAGTYENYAEALMNNGDNESALKNFKKALELDSENANLQQMIKKLKDIN